MEFVQRRLGAQLIIAPRRSLPREQHDGNETASGECLGKKRTYVVTDSKARKQTRANIDRWVRFVAFLSIGAEGTVGDWPPLIARGGRRHSIDPRIHGPLSVSLAVQLDRE